MMKQHIWIVTGPAGCGKTTVAKGLSGELSLPYVEGDDVSTLPVFKQVNLSNSGATNKVPLRC